jgi:hypothetical protein
MKAMILILLLATLCGCATQERIYKLSVTVQVEHPDGTHMGVMDLPLLVSDDVGHSYCRSQWSELNVTWERLK